MIIKNSYNMIPKNKQKTSNNFINISDESINKSISNVTRELYSIKEKACIDLAIGFPYLFDGLIKYIKPSNISIDVNRMEISYYTNCINKITNNNILLYSENLTNGLNENNNISKLYFYKDWEDYNIESLKNYENNNEIVTYHKDDIPLILKNKIYFWIVDMNLINENAFRADDLPAICCNGVLLADLINRLEGVFYIKLEIWIY